jgi:hypothetical protein
LILLGASVFFALIISEVGLRIVGFSYFNPYTYDPKLGSTLRPNAEGWWTKEGTTYVKINSQGFRDYEHALQKPNDTIRIAVLGDSFSEALQVSIQNTFWSVMQRQLQSALAPRHKQVEVLNFGVSRFSTARELIMLRERVWQYEPDAVVLQFTPGNDVKDNSRILTGDSEAFPYFVYKDKALVLDDSLLKNRNEQFSFKLRRSFAGTGLNWLRDHSRVLGLAYTLRESYFSPARKSPSGHSRPDIEPGLDDDSYRYPINQDWTDAWLVTEKLIVQLRDEVKAKGAKFLVVTATKGVQVAPDASLRAEYMKKLGVTTLAYPDDRIRELGAREGFEVLILGPPFLEFAERNQVYLHGFGDTKGLGHWNDEGHKLAGELIAEKLKQML